jgi:hypothetical protein
MKYLFMMIYLKTVKSYEEVLNRFQALPPDSQTGFTSFQSHKRSCLPKILQGEISTPSPEQQEPPPGFETNIQDKANNKGKLKNTEIPSQDTKGSQTKETGKEKGKEHNSKNHEECSRKDRRNNFNRTW